MPFQEVRFLFVFRHEGDAMDHNGENVVDLNVSLKLVLNYLTNNKCPTLDNPPLVKKRASVAVIIRVSPKQDYRTSALPASTTQHTLDSFFALDWVKHGNAEVLFIKRAERPGDRWTSHVAFPGGRRDPADKDDNAAAIRETMEEVGLDISANNMNIIKVGNLPQRVVKTQWGKVPLMVLCPYIFLLTTPTTPPLQLEPAEVASCHWVPMSELLDKSNRTVHREDVSNRLAKQQTGVGKWMLKVMLGKMIFAAINLRPSESIVCNGSKSSSKDPPYSTLCGREGTYFAQNSGLLLWGLTLGVMTDLLHLLPPYNAIDLWIYPTFTQWDVKFAIWFMTDNFRKAKIKASQNMQRRVLELAMPLHAGAFDCPESRSGVVNELLDGYYDCVREAVAASLIIRVAVIACLTGAAIVHVGKKP